jgi:hypothetical protein
MLQGKSAFRAVVFRPAPRPATPPPLYLGPPAHFETHTHDEDTRCRALSPYTGKRCILEGGVVGLSVANKPLSLLAGRGKPAPALGLGKSGNFYRRHPVDSATNSIHSACTIDDPQKPPRQRDALEWSAACQFLYGLPPSILQALLQQALAESTVKKPPLRKGESLGPKKLQGGQGLEARVTWAGTGASPYGRSKQRPCHQGRGVHRL